MGESCLVKTPPLQALFSLRASTLARFVVPLGIRLLLQYTLRAYAASKGQKKEKTAAPAAGAFKSRTPGRWQVVQAGMFQFIFGLTGRSAPMAKHWNADNPQLVNFII